MTSPKTNRLSVLFCFFLSVCFFLLLLVGCNKKETAEKNKQTSSNNTDPIARQFELDVNHYINSYNNMHWDEVIETTFPPMFGNKTKEDLMADYVKMAITGMNRQTDIIKIEKITPVVEDAGNLYAKIYFGANVQMNLLGTALENKDLIKYNLELSYDTEEVLFDESKSALTIDNAYCSMLAVSKKGSNIWKYIEIDHQKAPYLTQIIPIDVLKTLNNY